MLKLKLTEGKHYEFKTHSADLLIGRESSEILEVFRVVIEPGRHTPSHVHDDVEQIYYVISGEGKGKLVYPDSSCEEFDLLPGDVIQIKRNVIHQIFCVSNNEPLIYLSFGGFPNGKPKNEPTWDSHAQAVTQWLDTLDNA